MNLYREGSDDVTKLNWEIMGLVSISRKNKMETVDLLKISLLVQIGGEIDM